MKFLLDAQLPRRIAWRLREAGHDAVHTLDLLEGNRTPDAVIVDLAGREHRVVVTKDSDFVHSHLLRKQPEKLFLVSTGNVGNSLLEAIVLANLSSVVHALETADFVELSRTHLIVHG